MTSLSKLFKGSTIEALIRLMYTSSNNLVIVGKKAQTGKYTDHSAGINGGHRHHEKLNGLRALRRTRAMHHSGWNINIDPPDQFCLGCQGCCGCAS